MTKYKDLKTTEVPGTICINEAVKASQNAGVMGRDISVEDAGGETVIRSKQPPAGYVKPRRCPKLSVPSSP